KNDPLLILAEPKLIQLKDKFEETAILAKRNDNDVLYLDVIEPSQVLRFAAHAGQQKPIYSSSSGRAMLALMSEHEAKRILTRSEIRKHSPQTIVDIDTICSRIKDGKKRGWHVVIGEYRLDTTAISVGFKFGGEEYAITLGAP